MKLATTLLALAASIISVAAEKQSDPFYLVAISDDTKLNGTAFNACHEGAGIEGLCKGVKVAKSNEEYSTYRFNYTKYQPNYGVLTFELVGGNFKESEPMSFQYYAGSNVALPLFEPGYDMTYVSFDKNEHMYIQDTLDDTVTPPTYKSPPGKLYRWYVCETYYTGYTYHTLAWVAGKYPPQNPSCKKINILRQFVKK